MAFDADPDTGVAVVDSYDDPGDPFTVFGGTSVATPSWAGIMAIVNEGRSAAGENPLDHSDPTQTLEALYSLPDADYHDNLGGSNGSNTVGLLNVARYNEVTGLGSPNTPLIVPDLIAYGGTLGLNQSSLPSGIVKSPYNQTLTASGGTGVKTLTYSITSGSLPSGLSFQASTSELEISGTPTAGGSVTFTVTATDSTGLAASQSYTLTISNGFELSPGSLPAGMTQTAYDQTITASGGIGSSTLTVSNVSGSLPGLNIPMGGTNSLNITGTPTALGTVSFTVMASDSAGDTTSASYSIVIGPGPASEVVITTQARTLTAGIASSIITVELEDAYGNVINAGSGGVTFSLSSTSTAGSFLNTSGNPLSSSRISVANGPATASFEYEDTLAGTPTLTVSTAGFSATQQETVIPATARALGFSTQPVAITAGQPSAIITVEMRDPYGNPVPAGSAGVTVNLSTSSTAGAFLDAGGDPLASPVLVIAAGNDSASFAYTDTSAGMPTLTLTSNGLTAATQQETVSALSANRLILTAPGQVIGGGTFGITVDAEDIYGNIDTSYNGSVVVGLHGAPAGVKLSGPTVVSVKAGVGTLAGLSLNLPGGPDTLSANSSGNVLSGVSNAITVSPTTHFAFSGMPGQLTAGSSFTLKVTAETASNHVDPGYLGTIFLASSDPRAVFAGGSTLTFTAGEEGIALVTVTLKTAGNATVSAVDMTKKTAAGVSPAVVVGAASVAAFTVTGATTAVAGNPYSFQVIAVDGFGNRVKGYTGTVYFGSDNLATLPARYVFTRADQGSHTFTATLRDVVEYTITASDPVHQLNGSDSDINVLSPATHLGIRVSSTQTSAGQTITITVSPLTSKKTLDAQFADTLHFKSSDPNASLPADVVFSPDFTGTETFTITLTTAGNQTITVVDVNRPAISGTSPAIAVAAGALAGLSVTGSSTAVAGSAYHVKVTAVDAYGNRVTGYRGEVYLESTRQVLATHTYTSTDNSSYTFTTEFLDVGTYTLTAVDPYYGLIQNEAAITVVSAATHLGISVLTTGTTAGQKITITVTPLTSKQTVDTQFTDELHFTSSDPHAVLPADVTFSPNFNGSETFTVTLTTAGSQTITVTDLTRPAIAGTSPVITVTPAPAIDVILHRRRRMASFSSDV